MARRRKAGYSKCRSHACGGHSANDVDVATSARQPISKARDQEPVAEKQPDTGRAISRRLIEAEKTVLACPARELAERKPIQQNSKERRDRQPDEQVQQNAAKDDRHP